MKTELKKEFKDKLVKLGVYRRWRKNFIDYCNSKYVDTDIRLQSLNEEVVFCNFIGCSFFWKNTPEGHDFWRQVSER